MGICYRLCFWSLIQIGHESLTSHFMAWIVDSSLFRFPAWILALLWIQTWYMTTSQLSLHNTSVRLLPFKLCNPQLTIASQVPTTCRISNKAAYHHFTPYAFRKRSSNQRINDLYSPRPFLKKPTVAPLKEPIIWVWSLLLNTSHPWKHALI